MGVPVNGGSSDADDRIPTASTDTMAPPPSLPRSPSELPPAALDLASRLFDLARTGATGALAAYIDAGIPKNLTNQNGDTLIMLAAYHDHSDTVRMLLDKGADPNVLNGRGQSPIAGAVFKGYVDVVKVLVEGGADIFAGQPTAPDTARMFRRPDLLQILGVEDDAQASAEGGPVGPPPAGT